jgi:hypothetical protein
MANAACAMTANPTKHSHLPTSALMTAERMQQD